MTPYYAFIPWFAPKGFQLGPFNLSLFGLFAALGVYLAARLMSRAAAQRKLDPKPLMDLALWAVLSGVLFGHLVHLVLYHPEELSSPTKVLQFWEGLSSFGGLLGGVIATAIYFHIRKIRFHEYADSFALGVAPGWGVARIGCFMVHDHPGVHTSFPLAVVFPDGPRHDLGFYDALLLFGIAALLYALAHRKLLQGRLLAVLALLYAVGRFYFDTLRARPGDVDYADARYFGLTPAQYFCFALVAYAIWQFWSQRNGAAESEQETPKAAARARPAR